MAIAKTINRLELTRSTSKFIRDRDNPQPDTPQKVQPPEQKQEAVQDPLYTGLECPRCHKLTLRLIEGCERCPCGYDVCQWGDLEVGDKS